MDLFTLILPRSFLLVFKFEVAGGKLFHFLAKSDIMKLG